MNAMVSLEAHGVATRSEDRVTAGDIARVRDELFTLHSSGIGCSLVVRHMHVHRNVVAQKPGDDRGMVTMG